MNRVYLSLLLFTHFGLLSALAKDAVKPDYKASKDTWESFCKAATAGQKKQLQGFIGQTITLEDLRIASSPDLCLSVLVINIDDPNPPIPLTGDKRRFTVRVSSPPAQPFSRLGNEIRRIQRWPAAMMDIRVTGVLQSVDFNKREIVVKPIAIEVVGGTT